MVEYDDIVKALKGKLNVYRKNVVDQTFTRLDRSSRGYLDVNDLKSNNNLTFI